MLNDIYPQTFDYSDRECVTRAIQNDCRSSKTEHLYQEIMSDLEHLKII